MEIGNVIRMLRIRKGIKQEQLAADIGVSVQTVSRWENAVNYPDLSMLPVLASYFNVTTDYLLGVKGAKSMAKLLKTVETFELPDVEAAEKMVDGFKAAHFPVLTEYDIQENDGVVVLTATKEFGVDLDQMKFD